MNRFVWGGGDIGLVSKYARLDLAAFKYSPDQARDEKGEFADEGKEFDRQMEATASITERLNAKAREQARAAKATEFPSEYRARVRAFENQNRAEPTEHAMAIGPNGDEFASDDGDAEHASLFTPSGTRDFVMTHNHPGNWSLSPQDVASAVNGEMLEVRAAVKDGAYVLRRTGVEWPEGFVNKILNSYNTQHYDARVALIARIRDGLDTKENGNRVFWDGFWKDAVSRFGEGRIEYAFEPAP